MILFGLGRYGGALGRRLAKRGYRVLGVDFSPAAVRRWRTDGLDGVYGDVSDPEFLSTLPLSTSRWAVSTIREQGTGVNHVDARLVLIQSMRQHRFMGPIAVTSASEADVDKLIQMGADLVLEPFQDAADRAVELLETNERPIRLEVVEPDDQREFGA